MSECLNCGVLRDELNSLRSTWDGTVDGWLEVKKAHLAIEFVRVLADGRLYVHLEPAYGETPREFAERSTRVRAAEARKHEREKKMPAPVAPSDGLNTMPPSLFDGRLQENT